LEAVRGSNSPPSSSETELQSTTEAGASSQKTLSVSRAMSAPSIDVNDDSRVSGFGLVLAGVSVEQDSAYWEIQVEHVVGDATPPTEVLFGVALKKDRAFYKSLDDLPAGE
jgi:hypothetical protein